MSKEHDTTHVLLLSTSVSEIKHLGSNKNNCYCWEPTRPSFRKLSSSSFWRPFPPNHSSACDFFASIVLTHHVPRNLSNPAIIYFCRRKKQKGHVPSVCSGNAKCDYFTLKILRMTKADVETNSKLQSTVLTIGSILKAGKCGQRDLLAECEFIREARGVSFHVLINSRVITDKLIPQSLSSFNEANYDRHKCKHLIVVYTNARARNAATRLPWVGDLISQQVHKYV